MQRRPQPALECLRWHCRHRSSRFGIVTGLSIIYAFVAHGVLDACLRVGSFPADPVTLVPSLSIPWDNVLVRAEFVVTVSEWAVDSLADALLFSAIGAVLFLLTLNIVNLVAWLSRRYTRALLGDPAAVLDWLSSL